MGSKTVPNIDGVSKRGDEEWTAEWTRQINAGIKRASWPYAKSRERLKNNLEKFRNAAVPQQSWMYKVFFAVNDAKLFELYNYSNFPKADDLNSLTYEIQPISCSLPTEETHTAEQFYLGTKRTVTTYKDRSGECTMEFYYRDISISVELDDPTSVTNKNVSFFNLLTLARYVCSEPTTEQIIKKPVHSELLNPLFNKITISLFNADTSAANDYILVNPIITNIEHSGDLSYESEDLVKWTITIHYDWWESRSYGT